MTPAELVAFLGTPSRDVFTSDLASRLGRRKDTHHGDVTYAEFPKGGISLVIDPSTELVTTVFVYAESKKKTGYAGDVPEGLSLDLSRDELRAKLGDPQESRDGLMSWDTWERGDYRLRAEYKKDGQRLKMFVLMG